MRVLIFYLNIITQLGEDSQPDGVRYRKCMLMQILHKLYIIVVVAFT